MVTRGPKMCLFALDDIRSSSETSIQWKQRTDQEIRRAELLEVGRLEVFAALTHEFVALTVVAWHARRYHIIPRMLPPTRDGDHVVN